VDLPRRPPPVPERPRCNRRRWPSCRDAFIRPQVFQRWRSRLRAGRAVFLRCSNENEHQRFSILWDGPPLAHTAASAAHEGGPDDCASGHRLGEERLQPGRRGRERGSCPATTDPAQLAGGVRREAAELHCGDGGVLRRAPLRSAVRGGRPHGAAHAAGVRAALREIAAHSSDRGRSFHAMAGAYST